MGDSERLTATAAPRAEAIVSSSQPIAPHVSTLPGSRTQPASYCSDISDHQDLGPLVRALCRYRGVIATAVFWLAALVMAASLS